MTFSNLFNFHSISEPMSNKWEAAFCTKFPKTCSQFTSWFHTGGKYDNPEADNLYNQEMHSGASIKEFLHYVQDALNNDFRQYDYGSDEENIKRYGTKEVPIIDLS